MEQLEQRQLLSAAPITYTDTDGDVLTVRLSGVGSVTVDPNTQDIEIYDTNVNSTISMSVKKVAGGDGVVTMGELRSYGPLRSVSGPSVNITKEISIDDNNVAVSKSSKVSINLRALLGLAVYTGMQRIGTLRLADWSAQSTGQQLNAPGIDSLIITGTRDGSLPGNCSASLIIGVDNVGNTVGTSSDVSIGSIYVAGYLADISAVGRVGSITAGQITGQMIAASFGSIVARAVKGSTVATGTMTGSIQATGTPKSHTSIGVVSSYSDASNLTISTTQGDIGQVIVRGDMTNCTVDSAGSVSSIVVTKGLNASRSQSASGTGSVRVGSISDSAVQVGVDPAYTGIATTASDFTNTSARLGGFAVVGVSGWPKDAVLVMGNNAISAGKAGAISLRNVDSTSSMQMYILDRKSPTLVRDVQVGDPTNSFTWYLGRIMPGPLTQMLILV